MTAESSYLRHMDLKSSEAVYGERQMHMYRNETQDTHENVSLRVLA